MEELVDCINLAFDDTPIVQIAEEALGQHYVDTLNERLRLRVQRHVVASVRVRRELPQTNWKWMHLALELKDEIRSNNE